MFETNVLIIIFCSIGFHRVLPSRHPHNTSTLHSESRQHSTNVQTKSVDVSDEPRTPAVALAQPRTPLKILGVGWKSVFGWGLNDVLFLLLFLLVVFGRRVGRLLILLRLLLIAFPISSHLVDNRNIALITHAIQQNIGT